ncbi:SusC/RagA family TonB-linked outer membrane protein [Bacteroidales bacterium]|nr:SusC/RagA family TonB-linked outer membrane protein [Bacteroidales bacterium]
MIKQKLFYISLFLIANVMLAIGQDSTRVFSGTIFNTVDEPVPFVSVSIENSDQMAITDENGFFELNTSKNSLWLSVAPIGLYGEKRMFVDGKDSIVIYLEKIEAESDYDEVLSERGAKLKRNFTGKVFATSKTKYDKESYESIEQFVDGRISGVSSKGISGLPGSGSFMLLNGISSLNGSNMPLVVVDGIPLESNNIYDSELDGVSFNSLTTIDPRDVSDLTILKDPAAAAKYGMRGSNGVILIETLKPTKKTTDIRFSFKGGVTTPIRQLPQLDNDQYRLLSKEMLGTKSGESSFTSDYPGLFESDDPQIQKMYGNNTNWQDEIFENGILKDAYFNIMGGDAIARYGLSFGYTDHESVISGNKYSRVNTRFIGTFSIFKWMQMYVSAGLSSNTTNAMQSALNPEVSPIRVGLAKSPLLTTNKYDYQGNLVSVIEDPLEFNVSNPQALMNNFEGIITNNRFMNTYRIESKVNENISIRNIFGLNISNTLENIFYPNTGIIEYDYGDYYNSMVGRPKKLFGMYTDNKVMYEKTMDEIHDLYVDAGFRLQTYQYESSFIKGYDANRNDEYRSLGKTDVEKINGGGYFQNWNWLSYYVNGGYVLKDRYIFDLGITLDYSTQVGKEASGDMSLGDRPFFVYYNIAGAWRASAEPIFANLFKKSDLKFRANYSKSGNDDIGVYNSFNYYEVTKYRTVGAVIASPEANTALRPENSSAINGGVDYAYKGGKLKVSLNAFVKQSDDMLIYDKLPSYTGTPYYTTNGGSIRTTGGDFDISSVVYETHNLTINVGANIGRYESIVQEIGENGQVTTELQGGYGEIINKEGEKANSFYGYDYLGVYSTEGELDHAVYSSNNLAFQYGDAKYRNVTDIEEENTSDKINDLDKVIIGNATPDFFGGVYVDAKYKRISFSMLWKYSYGNDVFNYVRYLNERMVGFDNQGAAVSNRWREMGQETEVPKAVYGDPRGNSDFSSRWIEDGSFISLKELRVGYTIPEKVLVFQNLGIYASVNNLVTFSNYLGYHPEFGYGFNSMYQGIDYGLDPMGRRFMIGVNIGL